MKIQCDVCGKEEASVFCTADEAAICDTCDHRVHHANKLASKHQRFSLLHPSAKAFPLCDVCQDKRAFLFCQQDRAILCKDCDVSIHSANELTRNHNRFLLTGVKLSATSEIYVSPSKSDGGDLVPDSKLHHQQPSAKKSVPVTVPAGPNSASVIKTASLSSGVSNKNLDSLVNTNGGICSTSSSTISEYLMETLPGWHVEDFLDSPSTPFGFCKPDDGMLSFVDSDVGSNMSSFSSENLGIWVPQATTPMFSTQNCPQIMGGQIGSKNNNMKSVNNRRYNSDDIFAVPQITPPSTASKRSRTLW